MYPVWCIANTLHAAYNISVLCIVYNLCVAHIASELYFDIHKMCVQNKYSLCTYAL